MHFILAGIAGIVYFFCLPVYPDTISFIKQFVLIGLVHLLIILLPYLKKDEETSFWSNFIYSLLLFVEASVFTLFFMGTLTLAIFAITELFGVNWGDFRIYENLIIVLISIFHPLYALSRIKSFGERSSYRLPLVVNIFSSKILFPVVILYAIILAAYMIKIIFEWSWPQGWISSMILWFAVLGSAAYAFIRYKTASLNKIESIFKNWYFPFLFLCSIVLSMAIRVRVSDYGITEPRYVVISIAVFLFVISAYYSLSKNKDLRYSLYLFAAITVFVVFSPWNVFDVPIKSQLNRMSELLEAEETDDIGLSQILLFLNQRNALDELNTLQNYEEESGQLAEVDVALETMLIYRDEYHDYSRYDDLVDIASGLGFNYEPYRIIDDYVHFSFHTNRKQSFDVTGFNEMFMVNSTQENIDQPGVVYLSKDQRKMMIAFDGLDSVFVSEVFNAQVPSRYDVKGQAYQNYVYVRDSIEYSFYFKNYSGKYNDEEMLVDYFEGVVLVK